jgi:hypothetical protein
MQHVAWMLYTVALKGTSAQKLDASTLHTAYHLLL